MIGPRVFRVPVGSWRRCHIRYAELSFAEPPFYADMGRTNSCTMHA